ncbi:MAG: ATP-binding protein [Candidatus Tectomicrobia bacterium]|uniref:ATP-binding protein n=1 Tax=Tectimicrobiota bacterium TaxID=2528274 RepID=A0A933LQL6_UNCTE|nr:ATP-binding protein [Candidatus Tectomicrobia bacterium]
MAERIAIIGAQGTGKTTLAKAVSEELSLPLICEGAREISELLQIKSPDQVHLQLAMFLQQAILIRQIILERCIGNFISDRSTVDCFVYWQRLVGSNIEPDITRLYERAAKEHAQGYQLLVFCPIEFPLTDDSFRYTNEQFQGEIDCLLRTTIQNWKLENRTLFVTGSPDMRLKQVKSRLSYSD